MENVEHQEHPCEEVPAFLTRYAADVDRWHNEAEQAEDSSAARPSGSSASRRAARRPATARAARSLRPDD